jgi:hypothetical protein
MAKKTNPESELRKVLVATRFFFIPKGTHHIDVIFTYVKTSLPHLCDDEQTTSRNTGEDYGQAEWKHYVRFALNDLKKKNVKNVKRNYWSIK